MTIRPAISPKWVLLLAGLSLGIATQTAIAQGKGGGKKPGGGSSDIPVTITVRDALDDKVLSDGTGAYVDGTDGVLAVITAVTGGLRLEPNASGSGMRQLFLRLSDEWVDGPQTCAPGTSEPCVFDRSNTQRSVFRETMVVEDVCGADAGLEGGLLAMANGEQRCARMAFWFSASLQEEAQAGKAFDWTERFRPGGANELTNDVIVTRLDANTWTVEATRDPAFSSCPDAGDCSALVRSKFAKGKAALITEGFFHVPFRFTVTSNQ
jgi:hypothetical protein